jgi:hypothetical protein
MASRARLITALLLLIGGAAVLGLVWAGLFRPVETVPVANTETRRGDASRPRLAVLVVFDQMRGDYLTRWESLFGDGGFHRLQKEGAWFQNCNYPYANTVTAAGHASLLTGCSPARHGMVGNDWYDRAAATPVYCVTSDRYQRVPPADETAGRARAAKAHRATGVSPERLLAPTVGDVLKEATAGKARVVGLSFKDRAAVLMVGRRADSCYWLDSRTGTFVTSTYYRDRLEPWVAEFNAARPAARWFGRDWTRLRGDVDYVRYSGPDDVPAEGKGIMQGRTFPHPLTGGLREPGPRYYEALYNSPFGNDLLLDLVTRAIDAGHLGNHDVPDLLCVSFSCNDPIGHCWGPDSQEVLDVTLRSDQIVKALLAHLDARVGKGRYLLALTADHGVCPLPEVARAHGLDAARVPPQILSGQAEDFLQERFGRKGEKNRWIEATEYPWIYLNRRVLRARGLESAAVEEALAGWLKRQPGVQTAYTHTQLSRALPEGDIVGQRAQHTFHPERCGDVTVVLKPYHLLSRAQTGTGHGTPHPYDTHVPLLIYGPSIRAGVRREAVTPQALAAIFAHALHIKPPAGAEAPLPEGLFENP